MAADTTYGDPDGVAARLIDSTDARLWASEWCRVALGLVADGKAIIDEGWMLSWFANALETGRRSADPGDGGALMDWEKEWATSTRLHVESIERTHALCDRIMEAAAQGDPMLMLQEVGVFMDNVDAMDEATDALFERAEAGLRKALNLPASGEAF